MAYPHLSTCPHIMLIWRNPFREPFHILCCYGVPFSVNLSIYAVMAYPCLSIYPHIMLLWHSPFCQPVHITCCYGIPFSVNLSIYHYSLTLRAHFHGNPSHLAILFLDWPNTDNLVAFEKIVSKIETAYHVLL